LKQKSCLFIGLTLCTFGQWNIQKCLPIGYDSHIIELNDQSFVVTSPKGKILVYTKEINHYNLLDEVQLFESYPFDDSIMSTAFDQALYTSINNVVAFSNESNITVHKSNALMNFLGLGVLNSNPDFTILSRALLFQSDPFLSFNGIISLGLIYILIYKSGTTLLSLFLSETLAFLLMIVVLCLMAVCFAYPLTLVRVIVGLVLTLILKHKRDRFIGFVLFFMFYNGDSLRSSAILYPLFFMLMTFFQASKPDRWTMLGLLQIHLFNRLSISLIVLYPFLRKMMSVLLVLVWLGYILPFLTPIILWVAKLNQAIYAILALCGTIKFKTKGLGILFLFGLPLLSSPWFYQVSFISVGQGDAILLQAPFNQEVILIDTGKSSAYGQLSSFLNAQGISRIDRLILSHDDGDHNGNWSNLVKDYMVIQSITEAQNIELKWFTLKSLSAPLVNATDNQNSLIYALKLNSLRFLFMGDAEELNEFELLKNYPDLKTDILKVAHHGSANATSDFFLSHIQAKLAIISVGNNTYGHPSAQTLARLNRAHIPVMTTKNEGDITFIISEMVYALQTSSRNLKQLRLGF